jgi:SAM-dependent methyltransferase
LFAEDWQLFGKHIDSQTDAWLALNQRIMGRSVLRLRGHLDLYESFMRGQVGADEYLLFWRAIHETRGLTPPDDATTLHTRHGQYLAFQQSAAAGDLAPLTITAMFDDATHRFVVDDGHHRACFLIRRGWRQIPARVPYEEFHRYINIHSAWSIATFLERNNIGEVYCPILHPLAPRLAVCRDTTSGSRLDRILYFLGDYTFAGNLLDIGCNGGFYSHHFLRDGVNVVGVDLHEPHISLARQLSELYRLPNVFHHADVTDLMAGRSYEAALLLTVLYHWMAEGPASYHPRLQQLHDCVEDFILWESGHDPASEKQLLMSYGKFTRYEFLGFTYGTGRRRELGVFFRPDSRLDRIVATRKGS